MGFDYAKGMSFEEIYAKAMAGAGGYLARETETETGAEAARAR